MGMMFTPCVETVAGLRLSMSAALRDSLSALLVEAGKIKISAAKRVSGCEPDFLARPADFTAYFDLLVALRANPEPVAVGGLDAIVEHAAATLRRLSGPSSSPQIPALARPRVITLGEEYFAAEDMASLIRWWDMEPDNAMDLAAVDADELMDATDKIERALDELEQAAPALYGELLTITQDIVIAEPGNARRLNFGGVSSFAAWGAIGINYKTHPHWADYLRTLVHETAHLLLFAIAREEPLVLNDADERQASPLRDDMRPVDGIFHAAFVSAREALALNTCLTRMESAGSSADPLIRDYLENLLNDSVISFSDCCKQLNEHACLSPLGHQVLQEAKTYMNDAFEVID